jgi:F-type H+-transporting ATPase subunit delta
MPRLILANMKSLLKRLQRRFKLTDLTPQARPYAKALFQAALETQQEDAVANEVALLSQASQTDQIISMIEDPMERQKVGATLKDLFKAELGKLAANLLNVLTENNRVAMLPELYSAYLALYEEHKKQKNISVSVPMGVSEAAKQVIKDKLLRKEGDSTNIVFNEVDSLIGGFVIQSGDEVLDLSIKGRLKKLVNQLNI